MLNVNSLVNYKFICIVLFQLFQYQYISRQIFCGVQPAFVSRWLLIDYWFGSQEREMEILLFHPCILQRRKNSISQNDRCRLYDAWSRIKFEMISLTLGIDPLGNKLYWKTAKWGLFAAISCRVSCTPYPKSLELKKQMT